MNKENCALKLVDEIILYYDARSKKHKKVNKVIPVHALRTCGIGGIAPLILKFGCVRR